VNDIPFRPLFQKLSTVKSNAVLGFIWDR